MLNAREAALRVLQALFKGQSLSQSLPEWKAQTRAPDQKLLQLLVYGSLREYQALYAVLKTMMPRPPAAESTPTMILILGLFQLLRLQLGDHGVINETVSLMQAQSPKHKALCNAILRRVQRERSAFLRLLTQEQGRNLPPWLGFLKKEQQEQIVNVNRLAPPFTVRVLPEYEALWQQAYPEARPHPDVNGAYILKEALPVQDIQGFTAGQVSVQDASAQRAVQILKPQNGERILDACAAPGGKTLHLLQTAPEARLTALDHDAKRLQRVRENLDRAQVQAQLHAADAAALETWWDGSAFDAILLDAPCSGSGVLRRHPDIAFLRTRQDLQQYPRQQAHLLSALWPTLKTGGRLLYCTCSILPQENQQLIQSFIKKHPEARLETLALSACENGEYGSLHLPDADGDGFFYALLHKV